MQDENMDKRDIMLCLSMSCDGDIDTMINAITKRRDYSLSELNDAKSKVSNHYMTILDDDYPKRISSRYKPPLVLYYKGDISLIQNSTKNVAVLNGKNTCDYATKSLVSIIKEISGLVAVVLPVSDSSLPIATSSIGSGIKVVLVSDKALNSNEYSNNQLVLIDTALRNGGLLLSETPDCSVRKAKKYYQMRLVSICSSATLVGGVSKKDPCIFSIATSLENGDDVYCIPFEIGSNYINNELIRDGAYLAQKGSDVMLRANTGA